ncbi:MULTISPECIES: hypothetical protein [Amycolatopsis]|uniref:Uncharacterized protein n=2 Tax=Amycolatopsis TaxID=1813 RepID=A0A1I3WZJ9_9PSEU|nr:hypothetical protein [Amycolatopsis sacchari]SFK11921.1 hypothetical protein SAMN05421835_11423 [Amycolatopsis sacchari]
MRAALDTEWCGPHVLIREGGRGERELLSSVPGMPGNLLVVASPTVERSALVDAVLALPGSMGEHARGIQAVWLAADLPDDVVQQLSGRLNADVLVPRGTPVPVGGAGVYVFDGGWYRFRASSPPWRFGARFPVPAWEAALPSEPMEVGGAVAEPVPAGLAIRGADDPPAKPGDLAYSVVVDPRFPKVFLSAEKPGAVAAVLDRLPPGAHSRLVLVPGTADVVRHDWLAELAVRLGRPVVVSTGVQLGAEPVVVDDGGRPLFRPFATVLRQPAGAGDQEVLDVAGAPAGWVRCGPRSYRPLEPGIAEVVADVVPSGLVLRPRTAPPARGVAPFDPAGWTLRIDGPDPEPLLAAAKQLIAGLDEDRKATLRIRPSGGEPLEGEVRSGSAAGVAERGRREAGAESRLAAEAAEFEHHPMSERIPAGEAPETEDRSKQESSAGEAAVDPARDPEPRPAGEVSEAQSRPKAEFPREPDPRAAGEVSEARPRAKAELHRGSESRPAGEAPEAQPRSKPAVRREPESRPKPEAGSAGEARESQPHPEPELHRQWESHPEPVLRAAAEVAEAQSRPKPELRSAAEAPESQPHPEPELHRQRESHPELELRAAAEAVEAQPRPKPEPRSAAEAPDPDREPEPRPTGPRKPAAPPVVTVSGPPVPTVSGGVKRAEPEIPAARRPESHQPEPPATPAVPAAQPNATAPAASDDAAPSTAPAAATPPAAPTTPSALAIPDRASTAAEQARFAAAAGEAFTEALATVNAALATWPALRQTDAKADYVAVCLYLHSATKVNDAIRANRAPVLDAHLPCLVSGLRRLPTHRRPVLRQAKGRVAAEGEFLLEPGFLNATANLDVTVPGAEFDVLIWPSTARRTSELLPGPLDEVVFLAGARFKALAVRESEVDNAPRTAVLVRELAPGEAADTGLDERDLAALARLDAALARRRQATLRTVDDPAAAERLTAPTGDWGAPQPAVAVAP